MFLDKKNTRASMNSKLTYVSLFSSAGIGCYGLSEIGFSCIATAEINSRRIEIQKFNNKCKYNDGYICGDLSKKELRDSLFEAVEKYKSKEKIDDITLLVATPPCQGMSFANHKKKNELSRNSLIVESIKIVIQLKPKFFIFENVSTFLKSVCTDLDGMNKSIKTAIEDNLLKDYFLSFNVVNFKNYGTNSSRTRTLVIGVRKDMTNIDPSDLFPTSKKEKTLKNVIGDLKKLSIMGEIDPDDIYHTFREYKPHMREWIQDIKEGQSAFDNLSDEKKPHQIKNGILIANQNKNGDKYKRQFWDKVAPCIHTRNDILASQNTIHPEDDRVFSIRELMKIMNIPDSFKWSDMQLSTLNALPIPEKKKFLKKNEMNIRQCIGEAVPTIILSQIGKKIKRCLQPC